jgi:hypothetical protein
MVERAVSVLNKNLLLQSSLNFVYNSHLNNILLQAQTLPLIKEVNEINIDEI